MKCRNNDALNRMKQILSDICAWRRFEYPKIMENPDDGTDYTVKPLLLVEAYERWYKDTCENTSIRPPKLGPPSYDWDIPRAWDVPGYPPGKQLVDFRLIAPHSKGEELESYETLV